eukprot:g4867.t1
MLKLLALALVLAVVTATEGGYVTDAAKYWGGKARHSTQTAISRATSCAADPSECKDELDNKVEGAVKFLPKYLNGKAKAAAQRYVDFIDDKAPGIACLADKLDEAAASSGASDVVKCIARAAAGTANCFTDGECVIALNGCIRKSFWKGRSATIDLGYSKTLDSKQVRKAAHCSRCTKVCDKGQPCGDSCIALNKQCTAENGCACAPTGRINKELSASASLAYSAGTTMTMGVDLNANLNSQMVQLTLPVELEVSALLNLTASASAKIEYNRRIDLGAVELAKPLTIWAGPVPIMLKVEAEPFLELEANAEIDASLQAELSATKTVSFAPTISFGLAKGKRKPTVGGLVGQSPLGAEDSKRLSFVKHFSGVEASFGASVRLGAALKVTINEMVETSFTPSAVIATEAAATSASRCVDTTARAAFEYQLALPNAGAFFTDPGAAARKACLMAKNLACPGSVSSTADAMACFKVPNPCNAFADRCDELENVVNDRYNAVQDGLSNLKAYDKAVQTTAVVAAAVANSANNHWNAFTYPAGNGKWKKLEIVKTWSAGSGCQEQDGDGEEVSADEVCGADQDAIALPQYIKKCKCEHGMPALGSVVWGGADWSDFNYYPQFPQVVFSNEGEAWRKCLAHWTVDTSPENNYGYCQGCATPDSSGSGPPDRIARAAIAVHSTHGGQCQDPNVDASGKRRAERLSCCGQCQVSTDKNGKPKGSIACGGAYQTKQQRYAACNADGADKCASCFPGYFLVAGARGREHAGVYCERYTECTADQYLAVEGTLTSDRMCASKHTLCGRHQWQVRDAQMNADGFVVRSRLCRDLTRCKHTQYQSKAPVWDAAAAAGRHGAYVSDRGCSTLAVCSVPAVAGVSAGQYEVQSALRDASTGQIVRARVCADLTVCKPSEYASKLETATSDRVCATKVCKCEYIAQACESLSVECDAGTAQCDLGAARASCEAHQVGGKSLCVWRPRSADHSALVNAAPAGRRLALHVRPAAAAASDPNQQAPRCQPASPHVTFGDVTGSDCGAHAALACPSTCGRSATSSATAQDGNSFRRDRVSGQCVEQATVDARTQPHNQGQPCTCPMGTPEPGRGALGEKCSEPQGPMCASCHDGYHKVWLRGSASWVAKRDGAEECDARDPRTGACHTTRSHCEQNKCYCDHGQPATFLDCRVHESETCVACDEEHGYTLKLGRCVQAGPADPESCVGCCSDNCQVPGPDDKDVAAHDCQLESRDALQRAWCCRHKQMWCAKEPRKGLCGTGTVWNPALRKCEGVCEEVHV